MTAPLDSTRLGPSTRPCRSARRRAVGRLYVDLGLVTLPQLNHALVECARTRAPLPAVLRQLGYM